MLHNQIHQQLKLQGLKYHAMLYDIPEVSPQILIEPSNPKQVLGSTFVKLLEVNVGIVLTVTVTLLAGLLQVPFTQAP
jgi:hypothetical protein